MRELVEELRNLAMMFRDVEHFAHPNEAPHLGGLCDNMEALIAESRRNCLTMLRAAGRLLPFFSFINRSGMIVPVFLQQMPPDEEQQTSVARCIGILLAMGNIDAYAFAAEAWIEIGEEAADGAERTRSEVIFLRAATRSQTGFAMFEVVRDPHGHAIDLVSRDLAGLDLAEMNAILQNLFAIQEEAI